jgi:hypothetical protein
MGDIRSVEANMPESEPPKAQFRPLQAFESAVREAPGYKLLARGLRKTDELLGFSPPAPKPEFKPKGLEWAPYLAGKIVGEAPTVGLAYLTGGAGAAGLLPKAAPEISKLAARGAGAGLTHGLFRQAVEPQPAREAIPNIALETAGFMAGDPAASWLGRQAGAFLRPGMRAVERLDLTKPIPKKPEPLALPPGRVGGLLPEWASESGAIRQRGLVGERPALPMGPGEAAVRGQLERPLLPGQVDTVVKPEPAAARRELPSMPYEGALKNIMEREGLPWPPKPEDINNLVGIHPQVKNKLLAAYSDMATAPKAEITEPVAELNAARNILRQTKNLDRAAKILETFPELRNEFKMLNYRISRRKPPAAPQPKPPKVELTPSAELVAARSILKITKNPARIQKIFEAYPELKAEFPKLVKKLEKVQRPPTPKPPPAAPAEAGKPPTPKTVKTPDPDTPQGKLYALTGVDIGKVAKRWTDKAKLLLKRETPERNFEAVMGKDAPEMIKKFLDPVHKSESDRIRWLEQERAEIKTLGIKARSKESELVQKYGEGLINEGQLRTMRPGDWQKIKTAADTFRQKYDKYLDDINAVLTRNGYDPIPKRKDYFRHFEDVTSLFEQYGIPKKKLEDLPTDINGITMDFKPGKNFFASALRRKGNKTTYDAITGIDGYLEGASRVMYHTDNIQRLRALEKALRREYADTKHLSNFTAELGEYTNILAGKKAMFDRAAEDLLGRNVYVMLDWLRHRVGANMIGANIASAMTQFIPLTQSLATTSKPAMMKALRDTLAGVVRNDGFIKQSDFLARRYGSDPLSLNLWQKGAQKAGWLFRTIDRFSSETIVRGKYYEGLSKGLKPEQALQQADQWAARIMADRSVGAMPTLFSSRTLGLLTQFQLEVNNQISFLLKDIPASSETKLAMASAVAQLFLYGYLFNNLFERVAGYRPALDPVGVAKEAFEDYNDAGISQDQATTNLIRNIRDQLPFASTLTGGRIPVGSALPNPLAVASGKSTAVAELKKPLTYLVPPFGGGQAKKTYEGIKAIGAGGVFDKKGEKLLYPISPDTANKASGVVFGKSGFRETEDYYRRGERPLSEKQAEQVRRNPAAYQQIQKQRDIEAVEREIAEVRKDKEMSPAEKVRRIQELTRRKAELVKGSR